jgi:hypothetical protein
MTVFFSANVPDSNITPVDSRARLAGRSNSGTAFSFPDGHLASQPASQRCPSGGACTYSSQGRWMRKQSLSMKVFTISSTHSIFIDSSVRSIRRDRLVYANRRHNVRRWLAC